MKITNAVILGVCRDFVIAVMLSANCVKNFARFFMFGSVQACLLTCLCNVINFTCLLVAGA